MATREEDVRDDDDDKTDGTVCPVYIYIQNITWKQKTWHGEDKRHEEARRERNPCEKHNIHLPYLFNYYIVGGTLGYTSYRHGLSHFFFILFRSRFILEKDPRGFPNKRHFVQRLKYIIHFTRSPDDDAAGRVALG